MRDGDEVADFRRRRLFALKDGCLLGRVHEAFRAELAREEHQDVVAARERFSRIEAVAAEEFGNLAAQVVLRREEAALDGCELAVVEQVMDRGDFVRGQLLDGHGRQHHVDAADELRRELVPRQRVRDDDAAAEMLFEPRAQQQRRASCSSRRSRPACGL